MIFNISEKNMTPLKIIDIMLPTKDMVTFQDHISCRVLMLSKVSCSKRVINLKHMNKTFVVKERNLINTWLVSIQTSRPMILYNMNHLTITNTPCQPITSNFIVIYHCLPNDIRVSSALFPASNTLIHRKR